ncbi:MAG: hypothetical protein NVSMB9_28840 [Isosphaeraceae bacterium]
MGNRGGLAVGRTQKANVAAAKSTRLDEPAGTLAPGSPRLSVSRRGSDLPGGAIGLPPRHWQVFPGTLGRDSVPRAAWPSLDASSDREAESPQQSQVGSVAQQHPARSRPVAAEADDVPPGTSQSAPSTATRAAPE